jgi:ParB/RepB/Spo0J family partition protein
MAKMGNGTGLRKIPLSQIVSTGNVREDYADIVELANSIKSVGQLEPILVKAYEPKNGIEQFEIIAGHRRLRAFQSLVAVGESFTAIDAIIISGDKLTIQLIENLQRVDLTADERERGIYEMCKNGLSQKEVAARLSKPEPFISRNVSAYKIREAAKAAGIKTGYLATATLNEIQAAKPADYPALVQDILNSGGTAEAARSVMENYRVAHGKPAKPKAKDKDGGLSDPLTLHPSPVTDPVIEEFSENGIDGNIDIETETAEKPQKKIKTNASNLKWVDEYEPPPHKQVDFNTVCLLVYDYIKEIKSWKQPCNKSWEACTSCTAPCQVCFQLSAANEIIARLHAGLCDGKDIQA